MINDFLLIFYWWILLFGLGVVFAPLTFRLFPRFFDKGYAFSKIIGILIVSYVVWLLGSLKILQFVPEAVWLVVLLGVALNLKGLNPTLRRVRGKGLWKIVLFEEFLFLLCLTAWSFIRGFQPDILGLEKFMDFGFVNSILRSRYFPPKDMWFAGETINYYYFGHLMTAVLTKLSGLDSAITYNLMVATIFALTFTAAFSLAGNLTYTSDGRHSRMVNFKSGRLWLATGLLSAFLLTLSGNLHTLWYFLTHRSFSDYWYPDATRFIVEKFGALDNTIHEFPAYSWVVADLHGHMINIPTILLILALLLALCYSEWSEGSPTNAREPETSSRLFRRFAPRNDIGKFLLLALCLAVAFMTNSWDFPIYLLVAGLVLLRKGIKRTVVICGGLTASSILLSLPFHLNFQNIAKGIALVDFHSPFWMLLVLWGFPLFVTVSYFAFRKVVAADSQSALPKSAIRLRSYITALLTVAWLLVLVPEIVYVKDIYIHSYQRANTMFKLTYQSFIMFSLTGGYIIVKTLSKLKKNLFHFVYAVAVFVLLIFVFIYPFYAIQSYYGLKIYQGLEGLKWFEKRYPDDYEAVSWLRKNIKGQPVILEAVGESYTDFARVSSNTGLPTVLGWPVHEWLWRGSYDEPGRRDEEVRKIYESADMEETKNLLTKYKVKYIFVGELERQKYIGLDEEKFAKIGEAVFKNEKTKIYRLPGNFN